MARLLPAVASSPDYYKIRHNETADWLPAIEAIASRHGLTGVSPTRFPDGENPVFSLGPAQVLKLVPAIWSGIVKREIVALAFLTPHAGIPAPRLIAHGELEDWLYVVSTRVEGTPLHRVWGEIEPKEKLRLAGDYGRLFAALHSLPVGGVNPGADWGDFCHKSFSSWTARRDYERLPPALQADGPRYLKAHGTAVAEAPRSFLHGDLAPENLHVRQSAKGWEIAGMIDFGNAMVGDPVFDLTAASILLQPGDRGIVHSMIEACLAGGESTLPRIRPSLMACTLIHPMGDLPECLDLVPGTASCSNWDEVAALFWPD